MLGGESEVGRQNERAGERPERERERETERAPARERQRQRHTARASEKKEREGRLPSEVKDVRLFFSGQEFVVQVL
jgi:hypothetical protein